MATRPTEASLQEVRRALQSINRRLAALESEVLLVVAASSSATDRLDNWSLGPIQDERGGSILDSDDAALMSHGNIEQWLDRLASVIEGPILDSDYLPILDQGDSAIGVSGGNITQASQDSTSGVSLPATFTAEI